MIVIFALISISLLVALVFLGLFIWSMRSGQYDDTQSPSMRVLFEDHKPQSERSSSQAKT